MSVLCGFKTWSLTLREKHRLEVVWEYDGAKREAGIGDWRKLRKVKNCVICISQQAIFG